MLKPGGVNSVLVLSFVAGFLIGCNTREEGCLDLEAVSFDVSAEKQCGDCCTYPELFWNAAYQWDTVSFVLNKYLPVLSGDSILFTNAAILVNNIRFLEIDGDTLRILDELVLECEDGEQTEEIQIVDDFVIINRSRFDYSMGMRKTSPAITGLKGQVGMNPELQCYDASLLTSGHPLAASGMYDQRLDRAATARFYYTINEGEPDSVFLHSNPFPFEFMFNKQLRRAANDTIRIQLDYFELFRNFTAATSVEEAEGQILQKLPTFFQYRE